MPYGDDGYGVVEPPKEGSTRRARQIGAVGVVVAALVATGISVNWIWDKADAVTPVSLPSAAPEPMTTFSPSVKPTTPPPPEGKVLGSNIVAFNNDQMPLMGSAWSTNDENTALYGGAATWLTVHKNYDGKTASWGNYVAFGGLNKAITFTNTPAGLKDAASRAGGGAISRLYDDKIQPYDVVHKPITVDGHRGHEITAKVPVKVPKLKETYSTILIAVIDRGDGTADVSIGDIAGSTPQWIPIWRQKVQEIKIAK